MKRRIFFSTVAALSLLCANAQYNSPQPSGYTARGIAMFRDANYIGCIQQLRQARELAPVGSDLQTIDYYLAMAEMHTQGHHAITALEQFLNDYPASVYREDVRLAIADCTLSGGDFLAALHLYSDINPDCLTQARREGLTFHKAYCMLKVARYDEARKDFATLTSVAEYANAARFYIGYVDYVKGDYKAAKESFAKVNTSTDPGNMADYYLSQIYFMEGDYQKAMNKAKSMLANRSLRDSDPTFRAEANRIVGESLYHLGQRQDAVPYLRRYLDAVHTPIPSALYIVGLDEYDMGNYDGAIKHLQPVSEDDNAMAQSALLYIGQSMLKKGDNDAAILAFDKALKMDFDPAVQEAAYYNYAVARSKGGDVPFGSAVATFEEFLRRFPNSAHVNEVQDYIVTGYLAENDYENALASINRLAKPSKKVMAAKQYILYNLGSKALAAGNAAKAIDYLSQAEKLSNYDSQIGRETLLMLGEAYLGADQLDKAESYLNKYISQLSPSAQNFAVAQYDLGYTLFLGKKYDRAVDAFLQVTDRKSSATEPMVADAWNRIADCYYYASDFAKAADAYDKAYAIHPQAGDYPLFQKAVMKGYARNYNDKIDLLLTMQEKFPQSALIPDAMLELTESYLRCNDNDKAIDTYRKLIAAYPNTAQGRQGAVQLALTLLNTGRRAEAIDAYKDVVRKYPTSAEASLAADELKRLAADDGSIDQVRQFLASIDNAPTLDESEMEKLSFEAAEKAYLTQNDILRLLAYIEQYPSAPHTAQALSYVCTHLYGDDDFDRAYRYASQLVSDFPDNGFAEDGMIVMAQIATVQGNGEEALASWKLLEQHASSAANLNLARTGIMRVARELALPDDMISAASAILASSTTGSEDKNEAIFTRALGYSLNGDYEAAQNEWEQIAGDVDNLYGMKSAFYIAQSLFDNGQTDAANQRLQSIIKSGSPYAYWIARAYILQSDIFAANGEDYKAKAYLEALRENYTGSETDIQFMIEQRLEK